MSNITEITVQKLDDEIEYTGFSRAISTAAFFSSFIVLIIIVVTDTTMSTTTEAIAIIVFTFVTALAFFASTNSAGRIAVLRREKELATQE